MTSIIGGYDTGLFDSSLFLLNRDDKTAEGSAGHGEDLYVNVANGNLVIMHKDAYLPSQGEDYALVRTYNSRGTWGGTDGPSWSNNSTVLELSQITNNKITLINGDTSRFVFSYDLASDSYISVDGAGAYQVIKQDKLSKAWVLTKSDQTVLNFDGNGDLKTSRDTNGNLITYVYAQGKLQSLKDDTGHSLTYSYSNGNLVKVTDETGGVLVQYEYVQNLLTAVIDRAGHRTTYEYYTNGQIKTITLPASGTEQARVLQFAYDPDPTDSTGKTRLLSWLTDAEGNKTYFNYKFNVDNFSKYNGGTTTVLNALGLNRRESNAAEYVQWRTENGFYATWDASRYATDAGFKAQADQIGQRHTVSYSYNNFGAITGVVDQAGYKTAYQYDAKENLTAITDANGFAITTSDAPYWRQLRAEYGLVDLAGEGKLAANLTAAEVAALQARYTTRMEYDARGNLTKRTDNLGNVTTFAYTSFNKVASQTAAMGHALATSDEASVQDKRAELGYPREAALLTDAQRNALRALHTTTYTYDSRQNVIELASPGGDITKFEYDSFGNLAKRIVFLEANTTDPAKQQVTQYFYDAFGQNIRTVDAEGFTTLKTFDHFGNVLSSTDGRGNVTRFSYDSDNQLLTVTTPEGSLTTYSYDSVGNRIAVRDANGHSVISVYDRNNLLVTTIDPKDGDAAGNRITTATYDVVGNRTKVVDAEGRVTTYLYREDKRLLEVRAPVVQNAAGSGNASYTTSYAYDGIGQQIAVTDANGNRTDFVYNEGNLLKRGTDAIGNVTEYRYDANLNQIQVVVGAQLATERRRVLRFSFDEEDQRIAETDALGGTVRYALDAVGNVVATTDANGHQTEYRFDRNNRRVTEIRPEALDGTTGLATRHTVTHQYDGNGNEVAVTDENGHTSRLTFDRDNRLVMVEDGNGIKTVYGYDSRNNRTSVQVGVAATADANGRVTVTSTANAQVQSFGYDEFNRLVSQTDGVGHALVSSDSALYSAMRQDLGYAAAVAGLSAADKQALLAAYTDRYVYDKVDNLVTRTDHLGRVTRMAYDGLDRMIRRTDALGQTGLLRYDGNGNLVGATDELGRVTAASYDAVNRLVSQTDALGVVTFAEYDNVGNLLARTQAAGTADARLHRYEYDLNNRVVSETDAEGAQQAYEYDAVGNRLKVVDRRGNATNYVYDARDRLVRSIDPLGFQTRVEYDGVGNSVALVDARGGITRLQYDGGNRLLQTTDAEGRVTRLEYDARGNRITQRTAVGTPQEQVTHFEYDAQNNLRAVVDAEGGRSESGFDRVYNRTVAVDANGHATTYAFDALNRQVSMVDAEGQQTLLSYDAVGNRLTQTDALGRVTQFAYDADNRATSVTTADGVVTQYAYDAVDNRIAMTRAVGLAEQQVTTYRYDRENRLLEQVDALGHATRFEYDANGNAVAAIDALGFRTGYAYDANNRVVAITDPLGNVTHYRYDGNGNRVQVVDARGFTSTSYYNGVNELVLAIDNEGYATSYAYDANGNVVTQTRHAVAVALPVDPAVVPVLVADARDQAIALAYDRLNRVVQRTDGEGYVSRMAYDAVGNLLATTQFLDLAQTRSETTRAWYDDVNRQVVRLSAEGYLTETAYDAVGNTILLTRRNAAVQAPADGSRPVAAAGDLGVAVAYVYDALNRLVRETDALGTHTDHGYNARGERTSITRAAGTADARATQYRYDAAGRLTDEINAHGVVTHLELDAVGSVVARHDAFGSADPHVTRFTYDGNRRVLQQTDAIGMVTATAYDANGNVVSRTVGAGSTLARTDSFEYDRNNRLVARTSPLGERTAYAWDATGNRIQQTDALGRVTDYAFDRTNRQVRETLAAVLDGTTGQTVRHSLVHAYDGAGNRIATTDENGHTSRYHYDLENRLVLTVDGNGIQSVQAYDARNNVVSSAVGVQAHVDAAGRVVVDSLASAQVQTLRYDAVNRLVALTDGVGNALASSDAALYAAMRQEMGYAAAVANLSEADKQALLAAYTDTHAYDRVGNRVGSTDHLGRTTSARYDLLNRLVERTDAAGGIQTFQYDAHDRLVAQSDALNRQTYFAYDAVDRLVAQADALGVLTRADYDLVGNLLARTEAAGTGAERTTRYEYDLNNRVVRDTDAEGAQRSYEYDAVGNRLRVVDGRGNATQYVYDARDRVIRTIDPLGFQTRFEYDGVGNRVTLVDARGGVTRVVYDAGNRQIQATDAENRVSRLEYDVRGNRVTQRTAVGTADEQVTSFEYDAGNHLVAVTDGEGKRSTNGFDRVYNRTSVTDGNGHTSHYEFDALNRQVRMVDAAGQQTLLAYDAVGNVLRQTDALGRVTSYAYDADNRATTVTAADGVVTTYAYDAVDNRIAVTRAAGTALQQTTSYAYDDLGRLLAETDALGHIRRHEYDANGNAIATVDALGQRTTYGYDANNRVVSIADPLGQLTQYRYDGNGNRVLVIDALGQTSATYYNLDNEATLAVNPAGEATSFQYDANGNVTAQTRHAVRVPAVQDPAVRPILVSDAADQVTRYAYDHVNRVVRTLDAEGALVDSRYDAVGNLVGTTAYATPLALAAGQPLSALAAPPAALDRITAHGYDAVNRRVQTVDAEGYTTRFEYDAVGNRTARTLFLSKTDFGTPALQQRTTSAYDAVNRLVSETNAIGVQTTLAYDAHGNLLARTDAANTADARSTTYSYDAANRRVGEVDALGTATRHAYDAADRLVLTVRADGQADARATHYAYDAAGRLVETVRPDGSVQRSVYDALGRVIVQVAAAGSAAERHTSYGYDRAGRVLSSVVGTGTAEALATTHAYDAFGNRTRTTVAEGTASARVTRFAYDHLDRLIAQTDGNGIVTLNDYDAFGNRIATSIHGETQTALGTTVQRTWSMTFAYDGRNLLVGEADGAGNVIRRDYDGAGNLRFQRAGEGTAAAQLTEFGFDLANRLVRKTVDPNGLALGTRFEYDARGNLVAQVDADGIATRTRFDALDRALVTTDGEGYSVTFAYDRFGNQTAITTGAYLVAEGAPGYDATKAARAMPATTLLAYDAMDRKVLQADALGTVTRYGYDARGNRTLMVEAAGRLAAGAALSEANLQALAGTAARTSSYSYDSADRLVNEVQPAGTVVHHAYNAAGEHIAKVVDFGAGLQYRNATTRYFYDAGGRLAFEADPVGSVTQTVYDGFGNVVRTVRGLALDSAGQPSGTPTADTRVTAHEYDVANRRVADVVDPDGLALRTAYEYDVRGRQVARVDANGNRSEMAYDAADRMVWSRDGEGFVTTSEYNGRGLATAQVRYATDASGLAAGSVPGASGADRRSTAAYDAAGRMTESVDARGVVTRMAYDAIGNRLATVENATGLYGSAPRVTSYTYNLANLVATRTDAGGLVSSYSYDGVYNLVEQRQENRWQGIVQVQVTSFGYDLNNRLVDEIVDPAGLHLHKAYRYDTLGNRVAEISANGFAAAAGLSGEQRQSVLDAYTRRTWFDAASRAVLTVDENGNAQSAQYDGVGNVVRSTQHATTLTLAQRQALNDLTPAMLAPNGADRSTDRVVDKADREILVRTAAARQVVNQVFVDDYRAETRTAYDGVGNVVSTVDGNGNTTYFYYDANNRVQGKIDAEGYLTVLTRDAFGNAVQERLTLDRPALSAGDKASLDLDTYALSGAVRLVSRAFDAGDHEILTVYPASELVDSHGTGAAQAQVVRTFDALGQVASETTLHRVGTQAPATHYVYDAAGRLVQKVDAQADDLLSSNAPEVVGLRKQLGYVNASGGGKLAAELTPAERAAITAAYACDYAYDALGNVREQLEAGRVTSFEYDVANRSVRVLYPAVRRTEVAADGTVTVTDHYRAEGLRSYDANGNVVRETKPDGERIDYRFDAGNRMVAALNDGVLVAYTYNFAGDLTRMHRYYNAAGSVNAAPAVNAQQDQVIDRVYDRLGRRVAELQLGNLGDGADDRVTASAYDANGNEVRITDARGFTSTLVYDGLNRLTNTINREGGVTGSSYDALGNVVSRSTGGFDAPRLVGGVSEELVSDRGVSIAWTTDHATDAQVEVRAAGSGAWTVFGAQGAYTLDHVVRVDGLAADTVYEYRFKSRDAFGYSMTSEIRTVRTSVGLPPVAVADVRQVGTGWEAKLSFSLPPGAGAPLVRVGAAGGDPETAIAGQVFTPVQQADGSYTVALAYQDADAAFQVEWTDATGVHRTGASPIQQRVETRRLDATVKAVPTGDTFTLSAAWNLADVLADQGIAFSTTPTGPSYSVYIGFTVSAGQSPNWTQATLEGGQFKVQFANLREGARTLYLQYVKADGGIVNATPIALPTMAGADLRLQNLELDFDGLNLTGTEMTVRTRRVGETTWAPVPQAAVKGTSVNLLGLAAGEYEYEATLSRNGEPLRNASGTLELREPASITGLADTKNPQATVQHTLTDAALTLPSLANATLGPDESTSLELTNEQGSVVPAQFADGVLDVAALTPGSYTLVAKKIRTTVTSTTSGTPPVTTSTTTVTVLSQIEATLVVGPLTLSNVEAQALSGTRTLATYAPGAARTAAASVSVEGVGSADHTWSFFDANGRKIFSNEEGGVWTRYFHDAAGNVTREVRFQRRDGSGQFLNAITSGGRPGLGELQADYEAAVAAHAGGADTARIKLRSYDAAGNVLVETELTNAHGAVTTRTAWDRFKNKLVETTAEGLAGLENTRRSTYDAANRLVHTATGPFEHFDEAGNVVFSAAEESYGYDGRGLQTVQVDSRGYQHRRHYDALGRLVTEWDGQGNGRASTLRTEYGYDGFDRVLERRAYDLTGRGAQGVQVTSYEWSAFDEQLRATDALGHSVSRRYDANGNVVAETDAAGATALYQYDAENRVTTRLDRLGGVWSTTYDAYGQRLAETDANGRVTTYTMGAFGQVLGTQTYFTRGYTLGGGAAPVADLPDGDGFFALLKRTILLAQAAAAASAGNVLQGAGSSSETMQYDWNGRLTRAQDSFGKHQAYTYNDADEQIRIDDYALGKAAGYTYDAMGQRIHEVLDRGGFTQRDQTYTYNNQGWLTSVVADAGFNAGGGAELGQTLNVTYRFDAEGNRVQVSSNGVAGQYAYDASGRMVRAVDDKGDSTDTIHEVQYDGYGNRTLENRNGTGTGYTYDAANRVVSSTAGEQWSYDANGNALFQRNADGTHSTTQYNAENRATVTTSVDTEGKATTSRNTYDAAGNIVNTRVDGDGFGFDEVTKRDVRYLEMSKTITNSYAKGAKGLEGATSFQYDANGNLTVLDRGKRQSGGQNVSFFDYDIEGHIIGRADKATALTDGTYFETFDQDPNASYGSDEYGMSMSFFSSILFRQGGASSSTRLQNYIYANNKPIAEASGDLQMATKSLRLVGGSPVYDNTQLTDASEPQLLGYAIGVMQSDLRYQADGVTIDRAATARAIAARAYDGWTGLSLSAQNKVANYVLDQLPATLAPNTAVRLKAYIMLADSQLVNSTQITDYSFRQIGASNPAGTVQNHVVRAGDTLQSLAAMYFGSPAYWYLIADANGLNGSEPLVAGTTLKIPNAVASSVNDAETFKVYNESEIIGSTSPEIRTIKKKKKWYQKLIQIVIVVIMIVAAVFTAGAALGALGLIAPGAGLLGMGASFGLGVASALGVTAGVTAAGAAVGLTAGTLLVSAVAGAAIYAGASILTQGLAVASGLQDKFSWREVGKAALQGAVSGAATAIGGGIVKSLGFAQGTMSNIATRVGVEASKQLILDGKINNVAGLVGAAAAGGAFAGSTFGEFGKFATEYSRTFSAGLALLEGGIRGRGTSAMSWVSLATSAIFDAGVLQDAEGYQLRDNLTASNGAMNWQYVAVHAIGAAVVGAVDGEDAALNYIGNAIGTGISSDAYREQGRVTSRTMQLKTLDTLAATLPQDKQEELQRLRERVLAGEENLAFAVGTDEEMKRSFVDGDGKKVEILANALYDNGKILINSRLVDQANSPEGAARLMAAMAEEVGEWAAAKTGATFRNDKGVELDAGAVLGLQTMTQLSTEAAAANSPLMFALDVGGSQMRFSTNAASMMTAAVQQFTPDRLLANVKGSFGAAQANWGFSVEKLREYAMKLGGHAADQTLMMGGMVLGVGAKGLEAVQGLATLAGDVVGSGGYLALKMAGADTMAEKLFGKNYHNMEALAKATMKFFSEKSIGEMAYEIFAKPLADGYKHSMAALDAAAEQKRLDGKGYSLERAQKMLEAGIEVGKFGVDVALAVLSITGAGAAAKSLFNMTTAVGRSLAGGMATIGRGGSITSAIESLAGRAGSVADDALAAQRAARAGGTEGATGAVTGAAKGEAVAGSAAHKATRWQEYQARGGQWSYERWSKTYENNMTRATKAHAAVEDYHEMLGWGKREVTVDATVDGVTHARRLDIGDVKAQRGVEYKTGYQSANRSNLWELRRDEALVKQGWDITWVMRDKASQQLLDALTKAGIKVGK